jgi:signal transduction histidine kinase
VRSGVDALRIGAVLLAAGLVVATVPALASLLVQRDATPWWYSGGVTALVLGGIALAVAGALGRRTTRAAAVVHTGTVLAALLLLPAVATTTWSAYDGATPWVHAYLPTAVAASVLVSRWWQVDLGAGLALVLADLRLRADVWPGPTRVVVSDVLFELTVLATATAVLTSVALSQRAVEREAAATAERFLTARSTEQVARRSAQWDALVHDEVLAALETIALDVPGVDESSLARSTLVGLAQGPPRGDVDHVAFRSAVLDAVLAAQPTATTRCVATPDARDLPPDAAEALLTAVTEALRNAVAHAYPDLPPGAGAVSVRLNHGPARVAVEVSDQGRGFDRSQVGPTSFGLALSIEGRIAAVGGLATVTSRPGRGTTVRMQWPLGEDGS